MSRAYTTTSRTARAFTEHEDFLVVVGDDDATKSPSIRYIPYHPINGSADFLPPLTGARRREEHSTPLLRTIPLPALVDIPISVHPVLSYTSSTVVLEYDLSLPPSTARLPPTTRINVGDRDWRRQPAMNPSTVGSMTIRIRGLERPVVVFPATLDSAVVTVYDVLVAVHRAVQASTMEVHRGRDTKNRERSTAKAIPMIVAPWEAYGQNAVVAGRGEHWWAGLCPCQEERDVWILILTKITEILIPDSSQPFVGVIM